MVLLALVAAMAPGAPTLATAGAPDPAPEPTTTQPVPERTLPPIADNEFLPEDANLSDCVGFVERPGCGSEARGGLQQTLIFVALAAGLAIIFWRISIGVRRNRRNVAG